MCIYSFPPFLTIALTGTPGTGKTQVSRLLEKDGYSVLHLTEFISEHNISVERDQERDCNVVDMDGLEKAVSKFQDKIRAGFEKKIKEMNFSDEDFLRYTKDPKNLPVLVVESHMAHCLCDLAIVLRSHPAVLKERLDARGYSEKKVHENVLSESIDVILCDCYDYCRRVYEIDNSFLKLSETASCVKEIIHALYEDEFLKFKSYISKTGEDNSINSHEKQINLILEPASGLTIVEEEGVVIYESEYDDSVDETNPILMKYVPGKNDWSNLID
ncbi:adenylate kinase family protein [Methanolapillus millepedarum]|uniref:Putative adenylate kinase n=1 Tax=Methanolapillus millepedarum TaxID=3028296 RepID=A0AA97A3F4_9EURY|nr:hypothetical protein MsAc7_05000 [Methanosarcinaceae archaeon Ac7]